MTYTIKTNWHKREIISGCELTKKEKDEFDYYSEEEIAFAQFFRYKRWVYDLGEFMRVKDRMDAFRNWHGYHSDSYFSGILVRFVNDHESVIIGRYYS